MYVGRSCPGGRLCWWRKSALFLCLSPTHTPRSRDAYWWPHLSGSQCDCDCAHTSTQYRCAARCRGSVCSSIFCLCVCVSCVIRRRLSGCRNLLPVCPVLLTHPAVPAGGIEMAPSATCVSCVIHSSSCSCRRQGDAAICYVCVLCYPLILLILQVAERWRHLLPVSCVIHSSSCSCR